MLNRKNLWETHMQAGWGSTKECWTFEMLSNVINCCWRIKFRALYVYWRLVTPKNRWSDDMVLYVLFCFYILITFLFFRPVSLSMFVLDRQALGLVVQACRIGVSGLRSCCFPTRDCCFIYPQFFENLLDTSPLLVTCCYWRWKVNPSMIKQSDKLRNKVQKSYLKHELLVIYIYLSNTCHSLA